MGPRAVKMATVGILRVSTAIQASLNPGMIRRCFKKVGICPVDENQILSQFRGVLTEEEKEQVFFNLRLRKRLMDRFIADGTIKDEVFDKFKLFLEEKNVDELVVWRRRVCTLTNENFIQSEIAKVEKENELIREAAELKSMKTEDRMAKECNSNWRVENRTIEANIAKRKRDDEIEDVVTGRVGILYFLRKQIENKK